MLPEGNLLSIFESFCFSSFTISLLFLKRIFFFGAVCVVVCDIVSVDRLSNSKVRLLAVQTRLQRRADTLKCIMFIQSGDQNFTRHGMLTRSRELREARLPCITNIGVNGLQLSRD